MNIYKTINRVIALREGGHVQRAHTTPHHGSASVAEHSWNVATLVAILHPNPSKELLLAALWHDNHERWSGDTPSPIKWTDVGEKFRKEEKNLAHIIECGLGIEGFFINLSEESREWLKACDMLECWLWCADQNALGNRNVHEIMSNISTWIENYEGKIPKEVMLFYNNYRWYRTSDADGWTLT